MSRLIERLRRERLDTRLGGLVGSCAGTAMAIEREARYLDNPATAAVARKQIAVLRERYVRDLHTLRLLAAERERSYGPNKWTEKVRRDPPGLTRVQPFLEAPTAAVAEDAAASTREAGPAHEEEERTAADPNEQQQLRRRLLVGLPLVFALIEFPVGVAVLLGAVLWGRVGWGQAILWAFLTLYTIDSLLSALESEGGEYWRAYLLGRLAPVAGLLVAGFALRPLGEPVSVAAAALACVVAMAVVARAMRGRRYWPGWAGTLILLVMKFILPIIATARFLRSPSRYLGHFP